MIQNFRIQNLQRKFLRTILGDDYTRSENYCRAAPEWLVLCINNFCNLNCKMCDVGLDEKQTVFYANLIGKNPQNMTLQLLNTILEQAESFWPRPRIGLAFTEPLIHVHILDFCRAIAQRGFYCSITTNGYLLPQLADEFVNIGLDFITISVDGSAEIHDSVRGRKGSFAKLYHGVEKLIQAKLRKKTTKPGIQFSYTLTDENYTDLVNFVQQVAALKIDSLVFSHLNFITHEMAEVHNTSYNQDLSVVRSNLGDMNLNSLNLLAMWKTLQELKAHPYVNSARPTVTIIPDFTEFKDLQVYYRQPLSFVGGSHCTDPWRMMMIKTDGTVIPAHGRCYNFPVGKINETSLKDIWNSSRFVEFRTTLKEAGGTLPACARCCGVIGKPKGQV